MAGRGEFHRLTVAEVARLCDDAVAVTFDVPAGLADRYAFAPGQSLTLRRLVDGRDERRSYSICAPAGARPRIGVREVPGGTFSHWLVRSVRAGDAIEVGTPSGTFTPDLATPARHAAIAAGAGITPVLSIAASVLADPRASVTLLYGNRRTDSVMFLEELADLKDRYRSRMDLIHVLSREAREPELFSGRLDAAKLTELLGCLVDVDTVDQWWLCGPFAMVSDARDTLLAAGVPATSIHTELFYVDDVAPEPVHHRDPAVSGEASEVTVILDGRSTTMAFSRDTAVLDGAQGSRPDLPFACKGGVCGTCRARVTAGQVDLRRNFALEDAELAAGFVLTCQSYPLSERVTIDYDA
ncbi:MAG: phenylacetate-CoA oxygenase/reductase subunit PaaK [Actinomycetota bacterium]|nr:phenylacetate-CoA oxygenase/reductase subunit PaaK [Actinomycetota bacterium]